MKPKTVYLLFLSLAITWVFLLFFAPYLASRDHTYFSTYLYRVFSFFCHQRPERCFFLWNYPLAVCARCTFIYIGALGGMLLYPIVWGKEVRFSVVVVCAAPLILDGVSQLLWRESTNEIRAFTGFLFGIILPFYFMPKFFKKLQ